jgi:hypothetical protein
VAGRVSSKQSNFYFVRTEINRNSICFSCFSVCFAKPLKYFSVCFGVLNRYRNNRNKQNCFETNQIIPPKTLSNRVSSKQLIFFSVRTETNQNSICLVVFWFVSRKQQLFSVLFHFVSVFQTSIETTETNRIYAMGNLVYILTNLLFLR